MGRSILNSNGFWASVLLLLFAINGQANVMGCSAQVVVDAQSVTHTANAQQPQGILDTKTVQTKHTKKSKTSFGYFGMFKLLIPDTLR